MSQQSAWKAEGDAATSLKANVDEATLVLQLGIAVTAIRAVQRFYILSNDLPGPGGMRDRFWAFLLAVAYLHEARVLLQPNFPKIKELALKAEGTEELAKEVGALISGKTELSKTLKRLRDGLVFHFNDEDKAIRGWVEGYKENNVIWAEGSSTKNADFLYRASTDAVANAILPDDEKVPDPEKRLRELFDGFLPATEKMLEFFEQAIAGYMSSVGVKLTAEDGS